MRVEGLNKEYIHQVIDHAVAYVDGNVHTNGCENFWSLLKRGLHGTYISVEPFHLFRYLDEQCFRFNNRKMTDSERFRLAVDSSGAVRYTFLEQSSGDATLDAQARQVLAQSRFQMGARPTQDLLWATATFEFGTDLELPPGAAESAP